MTFEYETLDLPFKIRYPKDFEEWAGKQLPAAVIYDRFKKRMHCTRCGNTEDYAGIVIRKGERVYCEHCGELLTAMPHTTPGFYSEAHTVFFWKRKDAIFYAEVWIHWIHNKGEFPESDRAEVIPLSAGRLSRESQQGYQRHYYYTGHGYDKQFKPQESPHLVGRAYNNWTPAALDPRYTWILYPGSEKVLYSSFIRAEEFQSIRGTSESRYIDLLIKELALRAKYPACEYIDKAGLGEYIKETVSSWGRTYIRPNWKAKTLPGFLRIKAQDIDKLRKWGRLNVADIAYYKILLRYRAKPQCEEHDLIRLWFSLDELYSGKIPGDPVKLARYFDKQGENRYTVKDQHKDYIRMITRLGYPADDDYYRYPKDLKAAHDRAVDEYNEMLEREARERVLKEREKMLKKEKAFIEKILPRLQRYNTSDDKYILRALESFEDIKMEGIHNHNCVGSYAERALKGETKLFVLRRAEAPETSFVTIELALNEQSVKQCYATGNRLPDEEVKAWVDNWLKTVVKKKRRKKAA